MRSFFNIVNFRATLFSITAGSLFVILACSDAKQQGNAISSPEIKPTAMTAAEKSSTPTPSPSSDTKLFQFAEVQNLLLKEGLGLGGYNTKSTNPNDPQAVWGADTNVGFGDGKVRYEAIGIKDGVEFVTLEYTGEGSTANLRKFADLANKLLLATVRERLTRDLEKRILDRKQVSAAEQPIGKGWIDLDVMRLGVEVNIEMHVSRAKMN